MRLSQVPNSYCFLAGATCKMGGWIRFGGTTVPLGFLHSPPSITLYNISMESTAFTTFIYLLMNQLWFQISFKFNPEPRAYSDKACRPWTVKERVAPILNIAI